MKDITQLIFFIFSLLSASYLRAGYYFPSLKTDGEKIEFLLRLEAIIPNFFSNAAKYVVDPLMLLDNQQELIDLLHEHHSNFEELYLSKKYLKITIKSFEDILAANLEIDPVAVAEWKDSLIHKFELLQNAYDDLNILKIDTKNILDFDAIYFLENIGKIQSDNKVDFKNLIQYNKDKNNILINCKKKSNLIEKFQCIFEHYHDLEGLINLPTKEDILRVILGLIEEQKILPALFLLVVKEYRGIKNWHDLKEQLNTLNSHDLLFLSDNDALKSILLNFFDHDQDRRFSRAVQLMHREITFAQRKISKKTKIASNIELVEIPAPLAIFRGFIGGDCSSKFSFAYPNDPHERVFFIQKSTSKSSIKKAKFKGYLSATEVLVKGQKALYVITMNGVNLSAGDTELIFRGLERAKKKLGVKHIVLPEVKNLEGLINYPAVKGIYEGHLANSINSVVELIYQDQAIREDIEKYQPGSDYNRDRYDHMEQNKYGNILCLKSLKSVAVTIVEQPQIFFDKTLLSKDKIIQFLINIKNLPKMDEIFKKIINIDEVKNIFENDLLHQIQSLFRLLQTCEYSESKQKMNIVEFEENIKNYLNQLGFESAKKSYEKLILPTYFLCRDAFAEENIEKTYDYVEKIVNSKEFHAYGQNLIDLFWQNLGTLKRLESFRSLLKKNLYVLGSEYKKEINSNKIIESIAVLCFFGENGREFLRDLIRLSNEGDKDIHRLSVYVLEKLYINNQEMIPFFFQNLEETDQLHLTQESIELILRNHHRDPDIIERLFEKISSKILAAAVYKVLREFPLHHSLVSQFLNDFCRIQDEIPEQLVRLLKELDPEEMKKFLLNMLEDPSHLFRKQALNFLKDANLIDVKEPSIIEALIKRLNDPECIVRIDASEILIKAGYSKAAFSALLIILDESDQILLAKESIVKLLKNHTLVPNSIEILFEKIRSNNNLAEAAYRALLEFPVHHYLVFEFLDDFCRIKKDIPSDLVKLLQGLDHKEMLRFLQTMLEDKSIVFRRAAMSIFMDKQLTIDIKDPIIIKALMKRLQDPECRRMQIYARKLLIKAGYNFGWGVSLDCSLL